MFDAHRRKRRAAEAAQARTRATAAMYAGRGFYNTNPWAFVLGILVAIFAALFTLDWLMRDPTPKRAAPSAPELPATEIQVDLE